MLRPFESNYNSLKRRGEKRGIRVTLTYAQFVRLCADLKCHYCDKTLLRAAHHRYKQKNLNADHIDRKDPRKGYSKDNTVPCCSSCNWAKNVYFTYEEMLVVGAIRQGNLLKAKRLMAAIDTAKNTATVDAIIEYVWKRKRSAPSRWNEQRKRKAEQATED